MTGKGLILDWALLFLSWNLAYGKNYLMSTVDKDFGFPDVQLMTGNSNVQTPILTKNRTTLPYRVKTVCCTHAETQDSSAQITINGSPTAVYGNYDSSYFPLFPTSALGTDYIVSTCHPPEDYASVLVIATHSHGTVASVTFRINGNLTFEGKQYSDGSKLTLILGPFEARTINTSADLTGTVVRTRDSVAVYSGLVYGNSLIAYNQLLPVKHYGQEYVVAVDDNEDLYQLQIISDHKDTSIVFNNGSTVCMGESLIYRGDLTRNENLFFKSNTPVMTLVCRVSGLRSGAIVVPSVKSYTQNAAMSASYIKIVTEDNATDIRVNVSVQGSFGPYAGTVDWVEIKDTRYKVGTLRSEENRLVYIFSETSYFSSLVYSTNVIFTGGYNFISKQLATDSRRLAKGVCSEGHTTDVKGVTDITTVYTPKSTKPVETVTILDNNSVTVDVTSDSTLSEGYNFSPEIHTTDTPREVEVQKSIISDIGILSGSELSSLLKNFAKFDTNNTDTEGVIEIVANITTVITPNATDLDAIVTILENKNVTVNITDQTVEKVLQIANNLLKSPPDILIQAQQNNSVANRLIKVVDAITDRLISSTEGERKFITDAFSLTVLDLTKTTTLERLPIGLQVTEGSANDSVQFLYQSNDSPTAPRQGSAVFFQESFLRHIVNNNTGRNVRLSMNYYSNPVLFTLSENSSSSSLKSKVISAKILVDGVPLTELYNFNITLAFSQTKFLTLEDQNSYSCVYWNFSGNENAGSWSTDGCQFAKYEGQTVCVCDHLTNFAVLLDYYGQGTLQSAFALGVITQVGLYLSIVGLSFTVISHVLFRDKKRSAETRSSSTLINLALTQLGSWIVFLAGIDRTENHVGCIVVAALLHYFILASFMWMLAMAVLYYLLSFKIFHTSCYMLKTGIPAWGIPVLPVVALLAVDIELYRGGDRYCWMSLTAFYYAFAAPVGLILLANSVLYIMFVVNICKRKSSHSRAYLRNIKASFVSFVILGLSWIFGFMAISDARLVFQYIFTITSSTQGIFIFVFFTLLDQRIRDRWCTSCCRTRARVFRSVRKQRLIPDAKTTDDTYSPTKYTEDTF